MSYFVIQLIKVANLNKIMNTQYMKLMIVSYFLLFFLHFLKVRRRFLFIKDDRSIHLQMKFVKICCLGKLWIF